MLAADGLLKSLSNLDDIKEVKDSNDDHDFGKVLEFCGNNTGQKQKTRYADGKEDVFSFDD